MHVEHLYRGVLRRLMSRRRGLGLLWKADGFWPRSNRIFLARLPGGSRISCDLRDAVQRSIWYSRSYEEELSALLTSALRSGDTFVDAGANVGWFTHLAARRVGPSGAVHAFEANPALAGRLTADLLSSNIRNVTVHDVGLGDRAQRLSLVVGDPGYAPDGSAHLGTASEHGVSVVRLDDYLPGLRADVLKMDIEGYEVRALRGMKGLLSDPRLRLAAIEASEENLARYDHTVTELRRELEGHNFRCTVFEWGDGVPVLIARRE